MGVAIRDVGEKGVQPDVGGVGMRDVQPRCWWCGDEGWTAKMLVVWG